jgi:hypothetical protein
MKWECSLACQYPDLSNCVGFLWIHLKSKAYVNCHRSITKLEQNIREEFAAIHGDDTVSNGEYTFPNTTINTQEWNLVI